MTQQPPITVPIALSCTRSAVIRCEAGREEGTDLFPQGR